MPIDRCKAPFVCALIWTLLCGATAWAQSATDPEDAALALTLDQARGFGIRALEQGDGPLALQIGNGLLQADPESYFAHMLVAQAQRQMGRPAPARKAGAAAYRFATSKAEKFAAAQLAARSAVDEERFTTAQIWLRRSLLHTPEPSFRPQIEQDYRKVRAMDPMQMRFNFSLAPSSNVNNGADSPYALIEGVPVIGLFDGLSQALSGVTGSADLALSYRLAQSRNSETRALMRAYLSRVWLDDSSLELANAFPGADVSNSDFSFASIEAGLRHAMRLNAAFGGGVLTGEMAAGKTWYGGDPYQRFGRVNLTHSFALGEATRLTLSGELEKREFEQGFNRPIDSVSVNGAVSHRLANADEISLGLSWRTSESDSRNANSDRRAAYMRYEMAQPVGPARLTFTLGAAEADYPDYAVGFIVVPGGRQDETVFGSIGMLFEGLDYAGFVPSVTLRAQRTLSNVSRFEASEFAISFGIQSRF